MYSLNRLFNAVAIKTTFYLILFLVPFSFYFISVTGNYTGEKVKYFGMDVAIAAAIFFSAGMIFIWRRLKKIVSDVEEPGAEPSKVKGRILQFPFTMGL
jgi:hypothetical protein